MRVLIFGCAKNGVEITQTSPKRRKIGIAATKVAMKSLLDKAKITDNDTVMFSSSMDFPKEYTSDKKVLALVSKLQSVRA